MPALPGRASEATSSMDWGLFICSGKCERKWGHVVLLILVLFVGGVL